VMRDGKVIDRDKLPEKRVLSRVPAPNRETTETRRPGVQE